MTQVENGLPGQPSSSLLSVLFHKVNSEIYAGGVVTPMQTLMVRSHLQTLLTYSLFLPFFSCSP